MRGPLGVGRVARRAVPAPRARPSAQPGADPLPTAAGVAVSNPTTAPQ